MISQDSDTTSSNTNTPLIHLHTTNIFHYSLENLWGKIYHIHQLCFCSYQPHPHSLVQLSYFIAKILNWSYPCHLWRIQDAILLLPSNDAPGWRYIPSSISLMLVFTLDMRIWLIAPSACFGLRKILCHPFWLNEQWTLLICGEGEINRKPSSFPSSSSSSSIKNQISKTSNAPDMVDIPSLLLHYSCCEIIQLAKHIYYFACTWAKSSLNGTES